MSAAIRYTSLETPLGELFLAATEAGVCRISWHATEAEFTAELADLGAPAVRDDAGLASQRMALSEHLAGRRRTLDLPLDAGRETEFQRRVREVVRSIPWGETLTYGEVANLAGSPGAARAVGGVMATNPVPLLIPCHRVLGHGDTLHGYGGNGCSNRLDEKARLLEMEGLRVIGPPQATTRVLTAG